MYKIYYNNKEIILSDDFILNFENHDGLFYKYFDNQELTSIMSFFFKITKINNIFIQHKDIDELLQIFSAHFTCIEAAGGLITNNKKQFLFINRLDKWDLPKGKLEKKESPQDAAIREVKEECGLKDVTLGNHIINTYHIYREGKKAYLKKTYWYEMTSNDKELTPQEEENIKAAIWVNKNNLDLQIKNTYPSIIDVLNGK